MRQLAWMVAAVAVAVGGARAAAPAARDRAAIVAIEREWLDHISDRATLERVLADDFRHPVPSGDILTRREHIEWAVAHPRPAGRRARFADLTVRVYGDTAIANGIVENSDASGGDVHRSVFTDVFVRRAGSWQAVNAQENAVR